MCHASTMGFSPSAYSATTVYHDSLQTAYGKQACNRMWIHI